LLDYIEREDDVNITKYILHAELKRVRPVRIPEQSFRSCQMNVKNVIGISQSAWRSDCLNMNSWKAKLYTDKKRAMNA
jgi:hypothetical protein